MKPMSFVNACLVVGCLVALCPAVMAQDVFAPTPEDEQTFAGVRDQNSDCWFFGRAPNDPLCKSKPVPHAAAPQPLKKMELDSGALFDLNSSELRASSKEKVVAIAERIKTEKPNAGSVAVTGYADPTGPDAVNLELSDLRAKTVKDVLIQEGVKASLIRTAGAGSSNAKVSLSYCENKTGADLASCLAPNRRIELNVL